jgi:GNAT superfamily N-acetyltransferase
VTVTIRPLTAADVRGAAQVQVASFGDLDRREGVDPRPITDQMWERFYARQEHFLRHDPDGSWVADDGDRIVGVALALKRDRLWGLSLLVVDPTVQSAGSGRRLLDAALTYAEGCDRAVILSSKDPRAMRAYASSGFDLHPQVAGTGAPDLAMIPATRGRVRDGSINDAEWADGVDLAVRGAKRGPDQQALATDMAMFVVDDVDGAGYAYVRHHGEVAVVAATDEDTATVLLWRGLAHTVDLGEPATVPHLNAGQQWAIRTAYQARLSVTPAGPVFYRGMAPPPAYLPSGAYL